MNDYVCIVQEGQRANQCREALAEGLKKIGTECFGDDASTTDASQVDYDHDGVLRRSECRGDGRCAVGDAQPALGTVRVWENGPPFIHREAP